MQVNAEEFIRAWQTSSSIPEVIEKLNGKMDAKAISSRASLLRKIGVPVKRMPHRGRQPLDIPALKKLAKSLENGQ